MFNSSNQQIKVCSAHPEYQVPMIWTFAFPGAEWWCPFCGASGGMLGTGTDVEVTPQLVETSNRYKDFSEEYLHANAVQVCDSVDWNGEQIDPKDLPQEEKDRLQKVIDDWKYGVKLEEMPASNEK